MRRHILVLAIFFFLVIILTFPLVFKITTHVPGFFSTDEIYPPIWDAWRAKFSLTNNLPIWKTDFIIYPSGMNFYKNRPIAYVWCLINYELAIFTTPVLTYNLQVIINFLLAAFFTYLLVYRLTGSRPCSILSGIIFGFSPYIFVRAWQHLSETYVWQMPLFLWIIFILRDKDTLKIRILFITSLILTSINFGTMYYSSIILLIYLFYVVMRKVKKVYIKNIIIYMSFAYTVLIFTFLPYIKNIALNRNSIASGYSVYHRPFEDLFSQSAKPLSYFLPAVVHPIFGRFTEYFVGDFLYGHSFTEHTLYLGWVPIILAFIAFKRWRKRRRMALENNENFYIGFFLLLALTGWLFSQPPWWQFGKIRILMPSFFMYKVLPMYRAYCRFGILVMLAVAVLAGFGLKFLLEKFKSQKVKIIITCLFSSLVLFEFFSYPPFKVIDLSKYPRAYDWLKQQPSDVVIAEYPLGVDGVNEMYKFYQIKHEKKMINGSTPGTQANEIARLIEKLSHPRSAGILKWLGVKYVFVHTDKYQESNLVDVKDDFRAIKRNLGLKFVKSFDDIDVYEVIAKPIKPEIIE